MIEYSLEKGYDQRLIKGGNEMKGFMCIDDTDNLESIGTGELLENLCQALSEQNLAKAGFVTRHQLYVHEDIPYTSHNSSMCVELEPQGEKWEEILDFSKDYLKANAAEGSDPGLCVVWPDRMSEIELRELIDFGRSAKTQVLLKESAYNFSAKYLSGIHLSEHGGTGGGVIGALAGCGLRLSGSDGRLKGKIKPQDPQEIQTAAAFCQKYGMARVLTSDFKPIDLDDLVMSVSEIKPIFWEHEPTALVKSIEKSDAKWQVISKNEMNKMRIGR